MRIHPREEPCRKAEIEMLQALIDIKAKHELTEAEALRVVHAVSSDWIAGVAKHAIRFERHGNDETPGGLE